MKAILLGVLLSLSVAGTALATPPLNHPDCQQAHSNCGNNNDDEDNSNSSWDFRVNIDVNGAVLNGQLNTNDIRATAHDIRIVNRVEELSRSSVRVNDNDVYALAIGNRAENTSLEGILNVQVNTGRVEAEVRDVTIGVRGVEDATRSSISVSGNRIGATAIGNYGINRIGE